MKKYQGILGLILLLVSITFFSCENEKEEAPELPPYETMAMDFSKFYTPKSEEMKSSDMSSSEQVLNVNWLASATIVGFWNGVLFTTLAVPVASFKASFANLPISLGGSKFQWSYDVDGFAGNYTARLTGEVEGDKIVWEMYISKIGIGAFSELLWFSGTSDRDGSSGQWILNHSAKYPEAMLQIDWVRENDEVGSIKYTYIREKNNNGVDDNSNGSHITYGVQTGNYNLFYDVHAYNESKAAFVDADIEWSKSDHFGRIMAPSLYNDEEWHCWNNVGQDVDCE